MFRPRIPVWGYRPSNHFPRALLRAFRSRVSVTPQSYGASSRQYSFKAVPYIAGLGVVWFGYEHLTHGSISGIGIIREVYAETLNEVDYKRFYSELKQKIKQADGSVVTRSLEEGETPLQLANARLKSHEQTVVCDGIRQDFCALPSNSVHGEDTSVATNVEITLPDGSRQKILAWGIYDGHAGHATSFLLQTYLHQIVFANITGLYARLRSSATGKKQKISLESYDVNRAIIEGFLGMDAMIMAEAEKALDNPKLPPASFEAIHALAPALSGSCALLALYEPSSSILRVANVGDSRAVLGRAGGDGKYSAVSLSDDQTGFNASELARVNAEHPGESPIDKKTGRILGLAVTRAFGDARWKWTDERMLDAQNRFWAHGPRPGGVAKTPPYLTAKPEIKEVKIKDEQSQPNFLIMASDGFWDCTSSENAVMLVEQWLDARRDGKLSQFDQSIGDAQLRAEQKEGPTLKQDLELKGKTREWTVKPEHFVVEDDNCATHLVKNAFGGNRRSLFCGVMAMSPPLSRDVRDDISVHVVFFGKI